MISLLLVLNAASPTEAVAARVAGQLQKHEFALVFDQFDDRMKGALSVEKLGATWASLSERFGPLRTVGPVRTHDGLEFVRFDFERGALDLKLSFDDRQLIRGLFFAPAQNEEPSPWSPPNYANEKRFRVAPVKVGRAPLLDGELTLPVGEARPPVVLLIHGSGPNDLDETLGGSKMFKDLACGLSSRGIAVVRFNKRTHQRPDSLAGLGAKLTVQEEVIDDAVAALGQLRADERFDPSRVFVAGHSLGAELVPRIAAQAPWVAGGVAFAARARPMGDVVVSQVTVASPGALEAAQRFKRLVDSASLTPDDPVELFGATTHGAYWLSLRPAPPETAAKVTTPLLLLQGERDYQVTMADFALWKAALAKRPATTFKSFAKLNHVFVEGTGPSSPAEYEARGHVAAEVIDEVARWVVSTSLASKPR